MAYIDKTYFINYSDITIDDSEFNILLNRSEDIINSLTQDLQGIEFTSIPIALQNKVKKATAAQVETLYLQGGTESLVGGNVSSTTIGKFSYSESNNQNTMPISPMVFSYLRGTGLLYRGVTSI